MSTGLLAPDFAIPTPIFERARRVRLLLLDVDGILTDGRVMLSGDDEYKAFDIKDGHGIVMLQRHNIAVGIITGRTSRVVERRAAELSIAHLHQGCRDKLPVYRQLLTTLGLTPEQTAYAGDDVVDLPILLNAGLAVTVADAHPLVRRHVHWVTPSAGGRGGVRELCEAILHAHGVYDSEMRRYLA
ncbi:MAG: HAD hydrolase family protein [Gammaproteobacteria bacterium]|nr:HAD hydrolase family protein [Gammaproteobacteria bacterium]